MGLFGNLAGFSQFLSQLIGVASVGAFASFMAFVILFTMKKTVGIRVTADEEQKGLDISEHGMSAYPDFQVIN